MPATRRSVLLRDITPPVLVRLLRPTTAGRPKARRAKVARPVIKPDGSQRESDFYDETFHRNPKWKRHYTRSPYYPLWAVVVDRMRRAGVTSVVDLGCGAGQVASLVRDKGVPNYLGVDFSAARLARAREVCPEFEFLSVDILTSDVLSERSYDAVMATEFLEHIHADLEVLDRVRPGTHVFATVPNFGSEDHVRHFENAGQVRDRYASRFADLDVQVHRADVVGRTFFILDGIKT